jgi:hypothetical protein
MVELPNVDTHKDLHVAAVVDQNNKAWAHVFSTTRHYRRLAWYLV